MNIGQLVNTQDGRGTVVEKESFRNVHRIGVKHDMYPPNRIPGMFKNDVLYYFLREVSIDRS